MAKLTPEEFNLFLTHMAKSGAKESLCPVCQNKQWAVSGTVAAPPFIPGETEDEGDMSLSGMAPLVVVICTKCFYIRQFA